MRALLLSGGVDSSALAYLIRPEVAVTIDYGQRCASAEISAAIQIASELGIRHEIVRVNCGSVAKGDMSPLQVKSSKSSHPEWWPFRNQLLATFAAAYLIDEIEVELIFGSVRSDSVHADGRTVFFESLNQLFACQEGRIRVSTPALELTSEQLLIHSRIPSNLIAWSFSCHRSNEACGQCRGCLKRREALVSAGLQL